MKRKLLFSSLIALTLLLIPITAWPQTSAVPWSSFSGGFGVSASANTTVQVSLSEVVGTLEGGNTRVKSGFLVVRLQQGPPIAIDEINGLPSSYALHQNYPNPFNPATTIRFALPRATDVRLVVYDLQGREVRTLVAGMQTPGYKTVIWDGRLANGRAAPSGIYIARLMTTEYTSSIKLVLLR